jgi:hypothetical protein
VIATLPFGSRLRRLGGATGERRERGFVRVELASGLRGVVRAADLGPGGPGLASDPGARAAGFALRLAGATYLWGGTSSWGVDCSGLVQVAYAMAGIGLPRDARDQVRVTRPLAPGERARAGDLLFFGRGGEVNHVAMVTVPPRFVHAYGRVEEATFTRGRVGGHIARPELAPICLGVRRWRGIRRLARRPR